jgi:glycine/D-amino acid oxidase-like deaminating enzyme
MPRYEGADVAIVGGGIVGASLAAELAGRKLKVTLFDRTGIASGASGRNSGAIWHPADPVMAALYTETLMGYRSLPARLAEQVALDDADDLEDDGPDGSFRLPVKAAGLLALGRDEAALRALAATDAAAHPQLAATFLDPDRLRALEPGLAEGLAAVRYDSCFPVRPAAATRATATLARALGADIREGAAGDVRALARYGDIVGGVITADGVVHPAGSVIVAAGAWSPELIDPTGEWRPIRPSWGVVVELSLGDAAPGHVLEEAATGGADAHPESGFSLVTAAGRSALGSTYLPGEPDPAAWAGRLRDRGATYLPAIAEADVTGLRACARPVTPDGRPLAGAVPGVEGLFVAAGHGPWGMSTGPATAAHVAALVVGEPDPRSSAVQEGTRADRFGAPPA